MIFQVTGYSNSGKTTLITDWTGCLIELGYVVSVIKHHGHDDTPLASGDEQKDTGSYRRAGAESTLVVSGREFQWTGSNPPPLPTLVKLMKFTGPDIILIEGYKTENYPKAVILRGPEDSELLRKSTSIEAVLCPGEKEKDALAQHGIEALPLTRREEVLTALTTILTGDDTQ
ncbi:molybdopterin-guanine dinucleotide biosynthesis protein B [Alteribacter natronophilus]|uniref:molybdopterin-guanine dinucleotide biosynthesis protein B n=1 Tax=Alteribacter natronophilus TaxID=2583810 RepID=UPI00110F325B|nr:molybdopterin-guanine dinucleotide biosynthesis protein B [Alteribacter natronophilus]TMW71481.1 molybdopterin-guanine dinucleotide biosynthesis protein B [Alteribacter natronophilus]